MRPDFSKIQPEFSKENTGKSKPEYEYVAETPEKIGIKPVYTREDLENLEHLEYADRKSVV